MNGGVVGPTNTANASTASGVYSVVEATFDKQAGAFPVYTPVATTDPQFNLTTLLLHGDGSNAANNNTFLDSSTNAFTLTRNGTPTQGSFSPFSQTGWSAYFSGSSSSPDFVSTASSSTFNVSSGNWTVEAWFWTESSDASNRYITFIPASGTTYGLIPSGSNYALNQFGTSSPISTSGSLLKKSQWTHVAIVKNGATTYIYVDGVLGGSGTVSWSNSAHTIFFGGNGISYTYNYSGWISNARIVMGTALYTGSTYTVPTSPLTAVAGTQFLTLNNNRIYDSSGNNATVNLGVMTGPAVQPFSPFALSSAYGVSSVGGSVYFNGSTDYLSITLGNLLNVSSSANWTIEAWVYPTAAPGGYVEFFAGTFFSFGTYNGTLTLTNNNTQIFSAGTPTLNSWNHVVLVNVSNISCSMYLNGTRTATGGASSFSSGTTYIGANYNATQLWPGYISQARITNTAVYTGATYTVPTVPLTAITGTQLLLSGTNAGIYDSTAKNDLITAGTVQISTAQSKFGGSSMYFATSGDGLTIPANSLLSTFGASNFTIEFWIRYTSAGSQIADLIRSTTWAIVDYNNGNLYWQNAYASNSLLYYNHGSLQDGNWHHVAVVRSATSTLTMYVDGTSIGSGTDTNVYNTNSAITIGISSSYGQFLGYMDDIRITKGYARYTSAFTPPTTAFLNQ
jgi:hypothetical protein